MKLLKSFTIVAALAVAAAACVLGACTTAPTAAQATDITLACNADAVVRPTVTVLMPLATAAEQDAIKAAELAIDQVCSNPASAPAANASAILAESSGKIAALVATLEQRKAAKAAPAASAASS